MKKICSLAFFLMGFCGFAQEIKETNEFSLLDPSNFWSVVIDTTSVTLPNFDPYNSIKSTWYKFGKDTVINEVSAKILLNNDGPWYHGWWIAGYLRQDSSKIYFGSGFREILLYNFGLKVGETMESAFNTDFKYISRLDSIRDTTLNNSVRKIYYLTEYPDFDSTKTQKEVWVEGIGSLTDGLLRQTTLGSSLDLVLLPNYQLMNFYQANNLIYQMKRYQVQDNFSIGDIQPLLSADKLWSTMQGGMMECPHSLWCKSYYTKLKEDSVTNGIHYMSVMTTEDEKMQTWTTWGTIWENQDHQVFYRERRTKEEGLMYDFDCKPGEILHLEASCHGDYVVDSIVIKTDFGIARKHIYLNYISFHSSSEEWIEGIGSDFGILNGGGANHCRFGSGESLLCSFDKDKKTYQSSKVPNNCYLSPEIVNGVSTKRNNLLFIVYPNPVSGKLLINETSFNKGDLSMEIFTVNGELIRKECFDSRSMPIQVDVGSLKAGSYVLRVMTETGEIQEKVIIKQ